jgi:ribose 5-phosphate isomerase A
MRLAEGGPLVTDNGNYILDCQVPVLDKPLDVEQKLLAIPGVVGTGLFMGMADAVLIQDGDEIQIRQRP